MILLKTSICPANYVFLFVLFCDFIWINLVVFSIIVFISIIKEAL